jgi:hypothetical protein
LCALDFEFNATHNGAVITRRRTWMTLPASALIRTISEASLARLIAILTISLVFGALRSVAAPVTTANAASVVRGWLKVDPRPLGESLGTTIGRVESFSDKSGTTNFYVAYLSPAGFVVVGGDDVVEPIVAFASAGRFDPSTSNPLGALVSHDLPARVAQARQGRGMRGGQDLLLARAKWHELQAGGGGAGGPTPMGLTSVSDVRVAPLTRTLWSQQTSSSGIACYNYYTPPFAAGDPNNYPAGCVATAMGQLMRYFQFPTIGIGINTCTIYSDGISRTYATRGGDGAGGPYIWSDMPFSPSSGSTLVQQQAIGSLLADAGATVNMRYASSGSSSRALDAAGALVNAFHFSSAIRGYNNSYELGGALRAMINPNLDAGWPVLLGITGTPGGHAVVADGYGYSGSTLFHHLNLGWSGNDSAWYMLPTVDTSQGTFNTVYECVFNIYTNGTGEIVSGRVLDQLARPVSGATVSALGGGGSYAATTGNQGIYALTGLPSASDYSITVSKDGFATTNASYSTGTSTNNGSSSGNYWGANFTLNMLPGTVDHLSWDAIGPAQILNAPFAVTVTARNATNGVVAAFNGAAALSGAATGFGSTNVIVGNLSAATYVSSASDMTLGYTFTPATNIMVIAVRTYDGNKVSIWTDNGTLLGSGGASGIEGAWFDWTLGTPIRLAAGSTYRVCCHLPSGSYGYYAKAAAGWPTSCDSGAVGQTFFYSFGDGFPTQVHGTNEGPLVDLRYVVTYSNAIPVSPAVSGNFVDGVWTGSVSLGQAATNVTLTADDGAGHAGSSSPFNVVDPVDHIAWDTIVSPQNLDAPFAVTLSARDATNGVIGSYNGIAALSGYNSGYAGTNIILGNLTSYNYIYSSSDMTLGYSFTPSTNLMITAVRSYVGDRVSIWTESGTRLLSYGTANFDGVWIESKLATPVTLNAGSTYRLTFHLPSNYSGYYTLNWPSSFANGTIRGVFYYSYGDAFPTQTNGVGRGPLVDLRYVVTYSNAVPVSPPVSGSFINGVWSGTVAVGQGGTNVVLRADDGTGHAGSSNPFRVVIPPPSITGDLQSQTNNTGDNVTLTLSASSFEPPVYLWRRNGTAFGGLGTSSLTLTNVQPADSGSQFSCVVTNSCGSVTSQTAVLTVVCTNVALAAQPSLLLNSGASVRAVVSVADGGVILGGSFTNINGQSRNGLARLSPDGSLDLSWNPGQNGIVYALAASGTDIYVGGSFSQLGTAPRWCIGKLSGIGSGVVDTNWDPSPNRSIYTVINALTTDGSGLFVGGSFTNIGNQPRGSIAKLSLGGYGLADPDWNPNISSGSVLALAVSGTNLFVGGNFTNMGSVYRKNLAKIPTSGLGAADADWNPGASNQVYAIAVSGTNVYVGGIFTSVGGQSRWCLAKLDGANTGAADPNWNPRPDNSVHSLALRGTSLYAGGNFATNGGLRRVRLAKLSTSGTGAADAAWAADCDGLVYAFSSANNALYVGGAFTQISGRSRPGIAALTFTPLQLLSVQIAAGSQFQCTLTGERNQVFEIQGSADLKDWSPLVRVTNSSGSMLFSEPASNTSGRFYRAVQLP